MNPQNLTIKSQEAFQKADRDASERGHQAIEPEHLLKAFLADDENPVREVLQKLDVNLKNLDGALETELKRFPKVSGAAAQQRYFGKDMTPIVTQAEKEAGALGDEFISPEH
ncbi:hypothetical protein KKA00_03105, partial [bacterium]|nr:hypothetical protein [bacterium]